jgi:hypothetical protein
MSIELNQLEKFLNNHQIPQPKKQIKTFLGIAKQPHYENVLSNMYAFYFDENEEHGLKDLFIKSLTDIIADKIKNKVQFSKHFFDLSRFRNLDPSTEVSTIKNGRIDLLLVNNKQAIIIENKVYHHLNNNLCDYWMSVHYPDVDKLGVVLSLKPMAAGHTFFVNITHKELLDQVISQLGNYSMDASDKYMVFLKDLYQNIMNLTNATISKEEMDFYFKNRDKINQAARFKELVMSYVKTEVDLACPDHFTLNIPKTNSNLEQRARYYDSKVHFNLTIVVIFEDMLTDKQKLSMIIELRHDFTKKDTKKLFEKCIEIVKGASIDNHFKSDEKGWLHYYKKEYTVQEIGDQPLNEFISEKLENDHFMEIFRSMEDVIHKEMSELAKKN